MTNFISHETKIFIDQEPPLINKKVKTMIQEKTIYQRDLKNMLQPHFKHCKTWYMKPWRAVKASTMKTSQKNYAVRP